MMLRTVWSRAASLLCNLFRSGRVERDLGDELRAYVDLLTAEKVAAGMTADQARRAALLETGGVEQVKERVRASRAGAVIEQLVQDLRHGARVFAKQPAFTAIAVLSIAFGTGANVATFSVADALLLRPLPVAQPSELLTIGTDVRRGTMVVSNASYLDYLDIRSRARSFSGLLAYNYEAVGLRLRHEDPPQVRFATLVTSNFFTVLGRPLLLGRDFGPEIDLLDGREHREAILSYAYWNSAFAGDPKVVGRSIQVAGQEFTIIGVSAESFTGLHAYIHDSIYVPMTMASRLADRSVGDPLAARDFRELAIKGRLKPGVSIADARAELTVIGAALEKAYPATNHDQRFVAQTELEYTMQRRPLDASLLILLATLSVAVLFVACANVAGLLASRAPVRAREMALRLAIGANRARLVRQLITETLGIAGAGAVTGLGIGWVGISLLRQIEFPTEIISIPTMELDQRALAVSIVVAMACAFIAGVGPAVQMTRVDLVHSLKSGDARTGRYGRLVGRELLVAGQVACSLMVMTIAVFSVDVFSKVLLRGPGFRMTHMAKTIVDPGQAGYSEARTAEYYETLVARARAIPGVQSVALTSSMPMSFFTFAAIVPERIELPAGQTSVSVWSNSVDEHFFETLEIPILRGRAFTQADVAGSRRVAIVNDTLARHYWPAGDALGRRFQLADDQRRAALSGRPKDGNAWIEIVGVARTTALGFTGESPQEGVYFPLRQELKGYATLLATTAGDSTSILDALHRAAAGIDPDVPVYDTLTIERFYDARITSFGRVMIRLVAGMGTMGMALTMVGLYGLVSFAVSRRTREIGIRIAIGATYGRIMSMILRQGMTPAWIGLIAGFPLTLVMTTVMRSMNPLSYQYQTTNFLIAAPILLAVASVAALIPARRAANVQPTVALRCE